MSQPRVVSPEIKRTLYYKMLVIRRTEERIRRDYHLGEMRSPPHLYIGEEAIAAGVCTALRKDDLLFPYYRSHGWYLAKGGNLKAMIAELHGRATGCSRGWGGSMHLIDLSAGVTGTSAIVVGTVSHAAGAGLVFRMQQRDSVAVACFGDAGVEEGVLHETLNFANLPRRKLPVIFVCENNLYATNTHIEERQSVPEGVFLQPQRYGIPGVLVDGNDVLAVYRASLLAVERARRGEGPTFMECRTYRYYEHCGINEDYNLGYRTWEEVNEWRAKDPLILGRHLVADSDVQQMEEEISRLVDEAFTYAKAQPWPTGLTPERVHLP